MRWFERSGHLTKERKKKERGRLELLSRDNEARRETVREGLINNLLGGGGKQFYAISWAGKFSFSLR